MTSTTESDNVGWDKTYGKMNSISILLTHGIYGEISGLYSPVLLIIIILAT